MAVLLFDIDGTLLTAHGAGRRHYEAILERRCGRPVSSEGVSFAGRTDRAIVRDLLRNAGVPLEETDLMMDDILASYATRFEAEIRPEQVRVLPGIRGLLDSLAELDHVALGLLTGNLERTAFAKLTAAGLNHYFGFGAYGSDHEDRNQLPVLARDRAAKALDRAVAYSEMVVIGDTEHDVLCGQGVGAATVAVCTGYVTRESLVARTPDLLLEDFADPAPFFAFLEG